MRSPREHPTFSCGLGALTRMLLILATQLNVTLTLCLLKMGPCLRELVKCLSINLKNILPRAIFVLRKKQGKLYGIFVALPSTVVEYRHLRDAVPQSADS